jgi:hypothetical protein
MKYEPPRFSSFWRPKPRRDPRLGTWVAVYSSLLSLSSFRLPPVSLPPVSLPSVSLRSPLSWSPPAPGVRHGAQKKHWQSPFGKASVAHKSIWQMENISLSMSPRSPLPPACKTWCILTESVWEHRRHTKHFGKKPVWKTPVHLSSLSGLSSFFDAPFAYEIPASSPRPQRPLWTCGFLAHAQKWGHVGGAHHHFPATPAHWGSTSGLSS